MVSSRFYERPKRSGDPSDPDNSKTGCASNTTRISSRVPAEWKSRDPVSVRTERSGYALRDRPYTDESTHAKHVFEGGGVAMGAIASPKTRITVYLSYEIKNITL